MTSPLELLAPAGPGGGVICAGSGPGAALALARIGADPAEVVLLAPSRGELRSREWRHRGLRLADADGVAVVVTAPPDARLRQALRRAGYVPQARLLHAPDVERSRVVFPVGGAAAAFALRTLVPASAAERVAAGVLAAVPLPFGPTSTVFNRGNRPPLDWLARLEPRRPSCTAVIVRAWRPGATTVVYRFAGGRDPDAVVKLGGGCAAEAHALVRLGAGAAAAGARVAAIIHRGEAAGSPLVVQTPLAGIAASRLLERSEASARRLLEELAGWLEAWAERTVVRRDFTAADAERLVLGPARRLGPDLDRATLERLEQRCGATTGRTVPFVAAHHDLTAVNVLVAPGEPPAVVDWEHAVDEALPLGDLAYCAVDLAAAADGYRDRRRAFDACFAPRGAYAELVSGLLRRAADNLGLDPPLVDLCLDACWLRHAANERRAETGGSRPFLELLRRGLVREHPA